jgi:hypothetical protein
MFADLGIQRREKIGRVAKEAWSAVIKIRNQTYCHTIDRSLML